MHEYCFSSLSLNVTSADFRDTHSFIDRVQSFCPEIKVDASNSVAWTKAIRSFNLLGSGISSSRMYCVGSSKKIIPFSVLKVEPLLFLNAISRLSSSLNSFFHGFMNILSISA